MVKIEDITPAMLAQMSREELARVYVEAAQKMAATDPVSALRAYLDAMIRLGRIGKMPGPSRFEVEDEARALMRRVQALEVRWHKLNQPPKPLVFRRRKKRS